MSVKVPKKVIAFIAGDYHSNSLQSFSQCDMDTELESKTNPVHLANK